MVINTNITGTGNSPLAKPNPLVGTAAKQSLPAANTPAQEALTAFDSQASQSPVDAVSEISDGSDVTSSLQSAITNILQQPVQTMLAQANLSPETVLRLLQE